MHTVTFENLPNAVAHLTREVADLKSLLQRHQNYPETSSELLTINQAAEFLSLAKPTIYGLVSRREIPFMKKSKRLYFDRDALKKWVAEGKKTTRKEIAEQV